MAGAPPHQVREGRRRTVGYVNQFLRVIPRVSARDIVAEPLHALGVPLEEARGRGEALLARLNIPAAMWELAPATFSGGEQPRVNIARGSVAHFPILQLAHPPAPPDAGQHRKGAEK